MKGRPSRSPWSVRVTGPLARYVSGFVAELEHQGYAPQSVQKHLWQMAHLSRWMQGNAVETSDLTTATVAQFVRERRAAGYWNLQSERGARPLMEHLRAIGVTPMKETTPITADPVEELLHEFHHYLIAERGLVLGTVRGYETKVRPLLVARAGASRLDLAQLTGADVTRFLLEQSRRQTVASAKNIVTALRALLRFLYLEGKTAVDLGPAVPAVAGWRGGHLPRALPPGEVDRLLASCDRATQVGRRDFAILTLLARLGLRASEVADIELDDFDWTAGAIVIRGKGNRRERLPIPVDVGDAVTAYLLERPHVECRRVFLRSCAPVGAVSGPVVGEVVRRACERAGVPPVGAHRLRHTVATEMLRQGASLPEVAQILRHRTLEATATYAKLDRVALRPLARPWPEVWA